MLWGIYLLVAVATIVTGRELVGLILWEGSLPGSGGAAGLAAENWHSRRGGLLLQIAAFFAYAGSFVFGSGLAIVPFLHGGVVLQHGWLTERQFLDAVAVAFITPGPVVITTGFIGYLVAGFAGGVVAAGATFLPCFLLTVLPAPYFQKYAKRPALAAFVAGITAAATGAIAGSVVVLARGALIDVPTVVIALAALATAVWIRKVPDPLIMLAAALAGVLPGRLSSPALPRLHLQRCPACPDPARR